MCPTQYPTVGCGYHNDKTGVLTVVISPLVALMVDQVAGLEAKGIGSCATINGLLSMPERAAALDRVRLGDASIVIAAPEQLRSVSFRRALDQREIGGWVLDEAHCLSKWGHDFRPDYRYVGRFIREKAGDQPIPPVLCLTATAKPDVKAEIVDYFREKLGIDLKVFDGGAQRTNLDFVVVQTTTGQKYADVHQIVAAHLPTDESGGAIIYCSTRRRTEELADFLQAKGVKADYFHAGLPPETKKNVQGSFIGGNLQVIVATNAFGMGIDKPEDSPSLLHRHAPDGLPTPAPELHHRYCRLSLRDVVLSFAGYKPPNHSVHGAIAALSPGDPLQVRPGRKRWEILNSTGTVVGQLASKFEAPPGMRCAYASVLAIATWDQERSDPQYRERLLSDAWELVVPELVFEPQQKWP